MLKDYGIEAVRFSPFCDTPDEKGQLSKLRKTFLINLLMAFNKFNVFHSVGKYPKKSEFLAVRLQCSDFITTKNATALSLKFQF